MTTTVEPARRQWVPVRNWALWERPRHWVAYTLATEALTLALTVAAIAFTPVSGKQLLMFGVLAVLGVLQAETSRKIERARRSLNVTPHVNMTSVWMLPAILLLPPQLIAALAFMFYLHLGLRSWSGIQHVAPHRTVANATTVTLT